MDPALLVALIKLVGAVGPELAKAIVDAIHGNPQGQAETDAEYVVRMNTLTAKLVADTLATDAKVIGDDSGS